MKNTKGQLLANISLAKYTTWRVGGIAKQIYHPQDIDDLSHFIKQLPKSEPILWLGLGSNSLIRDGGFNGTVILTQGSLNNIELLPDNIISAEAGVSCAKMARFCARNGFEGGEFWAGIPGTIGGALRMNAGCFNGETWQLVAEVETITKDGEIKRYPASAFNISYRNVSGLKDDEAFIKAYFRLKSSNNKEESFLKIKQLLENRLNTQPIDKFNCGSVFRNPQNNFAAKLIEQCGLKGKRRGGAIVSTKHANFIINAEGMAKALDIEDLIEEIQEIVHAQTGIKLVREVHIIGDKLCKT